MTENPVIAIDGTAASGKGTLARKLAAALNLPHLDTGKLYRYVGLSILRAGGDPADREAAEAAVMVIVQALDPKSLSDPELMSDQAGQAASKVATMTKVRKSLLSYQKRFAAQDGGAILDGRDIGTVICPKAPLKLFVDATPEIRAERRHKELQNRGITANYDAVLADMRERDARDRERATAPMKPADDAVIVDTTNMNAEEAFDFVRKLARERLGI